MRSARPEGANRSETLRLAVLLHADRHEGREIWFARSVLTADVAHGASPQEALDLLSDTLRSAVASARSRGLSPQAWYLSLIHI